MSAWRDRTACLAVVLSLLACAHLAWPQPAQRADAVYLAIISVGYGHLLGALWLARERILAAAPAGVGAPLWAAFLTCSAITGLALHAQALRWSIAWAAPLYALSVWHIVENDLLLGQASAREGRLPPVQWGRQAMAMTLTATILAVSLATPEASGFLGLGSWLPVSLVDVFAVVSGYHLASWLLLAVRRVRAMSAAGHRRDARRRCAGLVALHAACAASCLAAAAGDSGALRSLATSPAIYLYWSVLHALQTAWARAARQRPGPTPASLHPEGQP